MTNKVFTFIIILCFSSFLVSGEVEKNSNKGKNKIEKFQNKKKLITSKEKRNINKVKPGKIDSKRHQMKLLREEFESRKIEIRKKYRLEMKDLKLEKKNRLEALEREMKRRRTEIKNS